MYSLRWTLEQRWSFQQFAVMCFVDFAAAFDVLDIGSLWRPMAACGMLAKLLRMIKTYYALTLTKVRVSGIDSLWTELFLCRKNGERHWAIEDENIVATFRPFLWNNAVSITWGGPNPPTVTFDYTNCRSLYGKIDGLRVLRTSPLIQKEDRGVILRCYLAYP